MKLSFFWCTIAVVNKSIAVVVDIVVTIVDWGNSKKKWEEMLQTMVNEWKSKQKKKMNNLKAKIV